jgi:serine/threonine-protein kinase SRPK3
MDKIKVDSSSSSISSSSSEETYNIDLTGDIINRYNVIVELGSGSYSIVWLVYSIEDNKYYAMKVQNPEDYEEGIEEINILKKISNKDKYVNNMVDNFIETRTIDDNKLTFVCSVYSLCCGNLDGLARKGDYKNGYPVTVVKKMLKQICLGLNTVHTKLDGYHGDIKPDNILLCGINNRDLEYIKLYEKANFPSVYIEVKKQYMLEKKVKKLSAETKLKIRRNIHQAIIEQLPTITSSQYKINESLVLNPEIKITDFGFYCNNKEQFNESFGTRYYQAPENILLGSCCDKVDVWSVGCMLYELLTGKILFDPESDNLGSTDYHHLEMMINLCGEFNSSVLKTTYGSKFFNKKNKLDDMIYSKDFNTSSLSKIESKLKEHDIVDSNLSNLLNQMLVLDPNKRISIKNILNHSWLSNC